MFPDNVASRLQRLSERTYKEKKTMHKVAGKKNSATLQDFFFTIINLSLSIDFAKSLVKTSVTQYIICAL